MVKAFSRVREGQLGAYEEYAFKMSSESAKRTRPKP